MNAEKPRRSPQKTVMALGLRRTEPRFAIQVSSAAICVRFSAFICVPRTSSLNQNSRSYRGFLTKASQIATIAKIANQTSAHSGIDSPSIFQLTLEQLPVPAKIFGNASLSENVFSRNSRSVPQVSRSGGKCYRYEWRMATPPPAIAKSATSTP